MTELDERFSSKIEKTGSLPNVRQRTTKGQEEVTTYTRNVAGTDVRIVRPTGPVTDWLDEFRAFVQSGDLFGLDVETTAINEKKDPRRMFSPDFAVRTVQFGSLDEAWVLDPTDEDQLGAIKGLLGSESKRFVSHSNYDVLAVWLAFGIALGQRAVDTMLPALLLEPGDLADHGLKHLSTVYVDDGLAQAEAELHDYFATLIEKGSGIRRGSQAMIEHGFNVCPIDVEPFVVYAGLDAVYVRRLWPLLVHACRAFPRLLRTESWLAAQTTGITARGIRLDVERAQANLDEVAAEIAEARKTIEDLIGAPALSPKRIAWLTERGVEFDELTEKGNPSLDKYALPKLVERYPDGEVGDMLRATLVLSQRTNLKANLASFVASADENGRVHPDVKTLRAHTGRMSIKYPALQTLKKADPRLRSCFLADEGFVLISADFANVELRVAAALAQERAMIEVFEQGGDLHSATAELIFGPGFTPEDRAIGKMTNFLTAYGGGAKALSSQAKIDEDLARDVIVGFRKAYPNVAQFGWDMAEHDVVVNDARRHIPVDPDRRYANSNYAIQSVSRDLLVEALYRFVVEYDRPDALFLLVHDEIVVQAREDEAEQVAKELEAAMTTTFRGVPIVAEAEVLGSRWGKDA